MRPRTRVILIFGPAILLLVDAGYAGLRWLGRSFNPQETTDISAYADKLKEWSGSGLVSQFPTKVPQEVQNVKFAAYPGYLQGGAYIQLRMQLPASEIAAIQAQFEKATTHIYVGGGMFAHALPTTTFWTSDDPKAIFDFPTNYKLYVLSAKDQSVAHWNHGETSGVAVSAATDEVVYWADSW
jgi:hypothetical protein